MGGQPRLSSSLNTVRFEAGGAISAISCVSWRACERRWLVGGMGRFHNRGKPEGSPDAPSPMRIMANDTSPSAPISRAIQHHAGFAQIRLILRNNRAGRPGPGGGGGGWAERAPGEMAGGGRDLRGGISNMILTYRVVWRRYFES